MNISLATINLTVSDVGRSTRFYVEVFGMRANLERSHPPGFAYLESERACLTLATGDAIAPAPSVELGFEVDDLDRFRARLAELDIAGFHAQQMGWGDVVEGHDPDGHRIVVYRLSKT